MNASPAAETTGPLVVLGATVILRGQGVGERRVAVADLATGPGRTAAAPGELLTAVRVPRPAPGSGSAYIRLEYRRAMEIAVVGRGGPGDAQPATGRRPRSPRPGSPSPPSRRRSSGRRRPRPR